MKKIREKNAPSANAPSANAPSANAPSANVTESLAEGIIKENARIEQMEKELIEKTINIDDVLEKVKFLKKRQSAADNSQKTVKTQIKGKLLKKINDNPSFLLSVARSSKEAQLVSKTNFNEALVLYQDMVDTHMRTCYVKAIQFQKEAIKSQENAYIAQIRQKFTKEILLEQIQSEINQNNALHEQNDTSFFENGAHTKIGSIITSLEKLYKEIDEKQQAVIDTLGSTLTDETKKNLEQNLDSIKSFQKDLSIKLDNFNSELNVLDTLKKSLLSEKKKKQTELFPKYAKRKGDINEMPNVVSEFKEPQGSGVSSVDNGAANGTGDGTGDANGTVSGADKPDVSQTILEQKIEQLEKMCKGTQIIKIFLKILELIEKK